MKSSDYWQKRFTAVENMNHNTAKKAVQSVTPAFDKAQRQIEGQITAWYQRYANNNQISLQEAKIQLTTKELKELKWDIDDYIKAGKENAVDQRWIKELENASAKYHISRLEALKIRTQQAAEVAFGNETDALDQLAARIYTDDYYHTAYEIQKGLGIAWDVGQIDQDKLKKLLQKPWTTDKMTFSDRIWKSKTQLVDSLSTELTQMCILGKAPDQAIANIAKRMNVSKNQAGRLIMTESAYFASQAQKDCFTELDVQMYEIVATLDSHTSEICQQMDGQHFDMKDYQAGVTAPPFHVWCRSTTVPYFDDFNEGATRAARDEDGKTYQVPADMKYAEWKENFVDKTKDPADWLKPAKSGIIKGDRSKLASAKDPDVQKILDNYPAIQGDHSYSDDIKATNPKYAESKKNKDKYYTLNCQRCVNAYEARRRGYDVTAHARILRNDTLPYMKHERGWANVYENGRDSLIECFSRTSDGVKKKVTDTVKSWGNGARGIVRVQWKANYGGGGHVFITECHNGSVVFIDPQSGSLNCEDYFDLAKVNQTYVLRTDDKEFSTLIQDCCDYKLQP